MTPSDKQLAIYDTWENTDKNILIQAVAGSGKTSTLLQLLELCKYRTLYLAFNKSIKEETEEKINSRGLKQGKALTIHALGLMAIRSIHKRIEIDNNKNYKIFSHIEKENKSLFSDLGYEVKMKLMFTLIDMNDVSRLYLENNKDKIISIMIDMDKIPISNSEISSELGDEFIFSKDKEAKEEDYIGKLWNQWVIYRESLYQNSPMSIDFTDMIYLPASRDYHIPIEPYYLMIDEAQDLNLCQHKLIDNLISQGTVNKWIACGDRNQSIYGFSGAFASSFDLFKSKDNVIELPLDICYRCPIEVVKSANEVYDVMIPFKKSLGKVQSIFGLDDSLNYLKINPNSMVICRNKGPLISLYFELIKEGIPCYLVGDDILGSIIKFLKPYKYFSVTKALRVMESEFYKISSKPYKTDEDKKREFYFKENYDNFSKIANNIGVSTDSIEDILLKLKKLFESKENALTLCTIHKSKGLESDKVFILNENLIPSKFAKSEQQITQETNLKYVARSRAKGEMYFLTINFEKESNLLN